jgi:hypothetical protein
MTRLSATALLVLLALAGAARAQGEPSLPCAAPARGEFPAIGEPPRIRIWKGAAPDQPPTPCVGWPPAKLVIALAGRFRSDGSTDAVLARLGAVSTLAGIRYWSVTDGQWTTLIETATALDAPDPTQPRRDFDVAEMKSGRDLFLAQKDNRSSGAVVYRLRVLEAGTERLTLEIENVTALRFFLLRLFAPGEIKSLYVVDRHGADAWNYYALTWIGRDAAGAAEDYEKSYVNRAAAFFRHIAGIPTDQEPPAAP